MKVGDTFPVTVAGHIVAQARVAELTREKATLVVPGTVVVMAVNTSLAGKAPSDSTTETIVTGVDRQTGDNTTVVESGAPLGDTSPQGDTAPETTDTSTTTTVETAPVETQATETAADTSAATEVDNGNNE